MALPLPPALLAAIIHKIFIAVQFNKIMFLKRLFSFAGGWICCPGKVRGERRYLEVSLLGTCEQLWEIDDSMMNKIVMESEL
jgi:hypothetical protein